jgi:glycosyltransferase involved in cell wall biosynthesis
MRVLVVGHTYTVGANRGKLHHLAKCGGVDLSLTIPQRWPHALTVFTADPHLSDAYELHSRRTLFEGRETRYVYFPDVTAGIRATSPDIVQVDDGPWSLVCMQVLAAKRALAPKSKSLFFTWWNIDYELSRLARAVEAFNFRHADWAIAGNRDAAQLLAQHGFTKGISVLPQLGVDPNVFQRLDVAALRSRLGLKESFVVGFVGRLTHQKGLDTLLQAFAGLGGLPHLVLVGGGELEQRLVSLAAGLHIGARFHLLGVIPHEEVPKYLSLFDTLVLPSRTMPHWKEQFGHVLIEAMACEVPVIGSDSGEIPNVIGDAGIIFPEGDAEALGEAIRSLMRDEGLRRELGRRGRRRVIQHYTNERIAHETYAIYCRLLGQQPPNA